MSILRKTMMGFNGYENYRLEVAKDEHTMSDVYMLSRVKDSRQQVATISVDPIKLPRTKQTCRKLVKLLIKKFKQTDYGN